MSGALADGAKVSVCVATHRRTDRLQALLQDLARQSRLPDQVVVVDNDAGGSARAVVEQMRSAPPPFRLDYDIQPERNIAMTRNRTVALAEGDWLAFIDDDERAPAAWLEQLLQAAARYQADGVLGPVEPQLPAGAPAWIHRGRFYDFPRMDSGMPVPLNCMRFGNIVLRGTRVRCEQGPFDPAYGLSTGEDGDLLVRLARKGAKIVWCDQAIVWEPIEPKRLSLRWLMSRALSGGQEFARQTVNGKYGPINTIGRARFFMRVTLQLLIATVIAAIAWPVGRHLGARWLITASANLGKLSVFLGWRYRAYA
jgi:succinoglycan biosynthesis protein ExoM